MAITNDEWDKIASRTEKALGTLERHSENVTAALERHLDLRIDEIKENINTLRILVISVVIPLTGSVLAAIIAGIVKLFSNGGQ